MQHLIKDLQYTLTEINFCANFFLGSYSWFGWFWMVVAGLGWVTVHSFGWLWKVWAGFG